MKKYNIFHRNPLTFAEKGHIFLEIIVDSWTGRVDVKEFMPSTEKFENLYAGKACPFAGVLFLGG